VVSWVSDAIQAIRDLLGLNNTVQSTDFSIRGTNYSTVRSGDVSSSGGFGGLRDSGGPGVAGQSYLIGTGAQPEMFVPESSGHFYPADQWMSAMGGSGVRIDQVVIYANSAAEGRAAADGFEQRLDELRRRSG
jgi:hypothetical protein